MEAIMASFLLIGVFLLVGSMFHRGMRYGALVDQRVTAVHLAEQQMARVRRAVEEHGDWVTPSTDFPEHSEFKVEVTFDRVRLYSPSSMLEQAYPFATRRKISDSTRRVNVVVRWGKGKSKTYRLTSYLNQAPLQWNSKDPIIMKLDRGESPIRPGEAIRYTATGYDADGKEIKDLFFHWNVVPVYGENSAVGRVRQSHDGSIGVLGNRVQTVEGQYLELEGFCKMTVTALLDGHLMTVAGKKVEMVY